MNSVRNTCNAKLLRDCPSFHNTRRPVPLLSRLWPPSGRSHQRRSQRPLNAVDQPLLFLPVIVKDTLSMDEPEWAVKRAQRRYAVGNVMKSALLWQRKQGRGKKRWMPSTKALTWNHTLDAVNWRVHDILLWVAMPWPRPQIGLRLWLAIAPPSSTGKKKHLQNCAHNNKVVNLLSK